MRRKPEQAITVMELGPEAAGRVWEFVGIENK